MLWLFLGRETGRRPGGELGGREDVCDVLCFDSMLDVLSLTLLTLCGHNALMFLEMCLLLTMPDAFMTDSEIVYATMNGLIFGWLRGFVCYEFVSFPFGSIDYG